MMRKLSDYSVLTPEYYTVIKICLFLYRGNKEICFLLSTFIRVEQKT